MPAIEVTNLEKTFSIPERKAGLAGVFKGLFNPKYSKKTAVDGISFSLEKGEVVGYIGVNGAGKAPRLPLKFTNGTSLHGFL